MNDLTPDPADTPLARLARGCAGDAFFLSHALTVYQDRHRLDDCGLAALLGCPVAVLPSVRLCRMPGGPGRDFDADVKEIADRFRLDAAALARVTREAAGGTGAGEVMEGDRD